MAGEPRIPPSLQRSGLKAEEKTLDFEFELLGAQFNRRGRYALRLSVENPLLRGPAAGVLLRVGRGDAVPASTGTTDMVEQSRLGEVCSFRRKKFTFTLPRGFCKNDKNHDVRLRIEALRSPGSPARRRRVGEAFFAIYPRPPQPRTKPPAGRDEDWYRCSAVAALLRVGSEQPAMHCGHLAFVASLHEHRPPAVRSPPLSPHGQERGQQEEDTAPAPMSPAVPSPEAPLCTPESAYHSLPTEMPQADPALSSSPELPGDSAGEHPSSSSSSSSYSSVPPLSCGSFRLSSPGSSPVPTPWAAQPHQDTVTLPPADTVGSVLPGMPQRSRDVPRDLQQREASRYRLALKRMAGDLLSLRRHVTSLEVENGHLRRRLAGREEPGGALLADVDVDVMTREEVLDRLATLKGELVSGTMEMRRLKDRVQRLQNELIRKNDREKELVLLQRAHRQQQAALRRCQEQAARTKGLEETVIEVMERVLQDRLSMSTEKPAGDLHSLLLAENRRLREELAKPPRPPSPPMAPRSSHGTRDIFGGREKLSLLARLEEAQAHGRVMERQLEEAARRWGREKQELGTRLLEREHGFGGSAPRSPHVPVSKQPPGSTFPPRRPRTLDPLP
ncbi:coiled-coil domain-containing protein 33 isoform X2 [Oxyura jamaicensis]|uniref:coiled-coil domain-containing protein 33 isoform X2 n=1 Tax=Oxyura jamaicensis TaxID=8884 RepID=UPI0015A6710F|nr:coiled-coil domain-containing protein 33 isoform X2 [Oxyura jamaicensis]